MYYCNCSACLLHTYPPPPSVCVSWSIDLAAAEIAKGLQTYVAVTTCYRRRIIFKKIIIN